jgi:hypothetical protein
MKTIKLVALVALFAVTGCKEATNVMVAHAKPMDESVQYHYSGANIPATAARGQVFEYQ